MIKSKVWYVTGASQGLGLTLVKKLLEGGYRVAATWPLSWKNGNRPRFQQITHDVFPEKVECVCIYFDIDDNNISILNHTRA